MNRFISALLLMGFAPAVFMYAQKDTYIFDEVFSLEFTDQVTIRTEVAEAKKPVAEWSQGGKVGSLSISSGLFEEIRENVSGSFRIQVESKKVGTLHGIRATDIQTGKVSKGIYNERDGKFSFGASKSRSAPGASSTDTGVVTGRLSEDMTRITDGSLTVNFISVSGGEVVSADAVFYFEAGRIGSLAD